MSNLDLAAGHERHVVLLVGGFDPSGGAGLLQDASVVRALGLHPVAVVTSIAVQNTTRLARRADLPAQLLKDQLVTLGEEFLLGAVKTGMLPTAEIVDALAEWLAALPRLPLVLDPVLRSTSGGVLVDPEAQTAMMRALFPRARVLTPNLDEARALTGRSVSERDDVPKAAEALLELGPEWVLVKGGHLGKGEASDYLASKQGGIWFEEEARHDQTRGTGCALASAIAAGLARGEPVPEAVGRAKKAVTLAMDAGYRAGRGRFLAPRAD